MVRVLKNWNHLPEEFNKRKKSGDKFPGYVKTRDYINEGEIADNLPEFMHFFDDEITYKHLLPICLNYCLDDVKFEIIFLIRF